jgi:hypothetical protein
MRMPSRVSRNTYGGDGGGGGSGGLERHENWPQTVMNVFILSFCNIIELLVSWVSRNDKVYELYTAPQIECVRRKEYKDRPVPWRTDHPRSSTNQGTPRPRRSSVRRDKVKYLLGIACSVWTPNTSNKDTFLALRRAREYNDG